MNVELVVPTLGRPSLAALLHALAAGRGPRPRRIVLVDDRRDAGTPLLPHEPPAGLADVLTVVRGAGAGPAAARNAGWRRCGAEWVAFLDDDVVPPPDWLEALASDLGSLAPDVGGSQGRIVVPLPSGRPPTDWERNVAGLERARWATADMAYRREVLARVGGFDARFRRAYREDADLALRVQAAGFRLVRGRRHVLHPPRPAGRWVSVRLQAGNADDALMGALHGPGWRGRAGAPRGRRGRHLALTLSAGAALAALALGRRRLAAGAGALWVAGTLELAWARIAPGPRDADEVLTMLATSLAIPPAATWHWLRGRLAVRRIARPAAAATRGSGGAGAAAGPPPATAARNGSTARHAVAVGSHAALGEANGAVTGRRPPPRAVLLDRDGTLVVDVPYNGDPSHVVAMPGARAALDRLRAAGVRLAVVSNQSGIARGLVTPEQVDAVNRQIELVLGPLGPWLICPHGPDDGCQCRKPAPGLVVRAAAALGVAPAECALIGDTGADVEAARSAGARGVLVPNGVTRPEEVAASPEVAADLPSAVALLLGGRR